MEPILVENERIDDYLMFPDPLNYLIGFKVGQEKYPFLEQKLKKSSKDVEVKV